MRKFTLLLALLIFAGVQVVLAQITVSGTVTSSEDGKGIPGATVLVKGTTVGVITDIDGKYSLGVPASGRSLVFSFVGMKAKEVMIAGQRTIDVTLDPDVMDIEGVVVTALGISRDKKSLGYAVENVSGEDLAKVRSNNVLGSLSGRVSGVQITTSSGQMGGGARLQVRGATSITGNNQPLYVVDGIPLDNSDFSYGATGRGGYDLGNVATDINADDIEDISILKGASATALYGSRAANGVVLITTKKAKIGRQTIGVSVNSSVTFENVSIYPKYQKLYGGGLIYGDDEGGLDGFLTAEIGGQTYRLADYATDESWGPAYNPDIMVLQWNAFDQEADPDNYLKATPWVYPKNDYTTFFNTAVGYQNNVQITGGNEKNAFRLSYTNLDYKGLYPNSEMQRNNVSFGGSSKMHKNVDAWVNANYVKNDATGRPETGYGDRNPVQKMWQWIHTSVDYEDMKNYLNPDGSQRTWNRVAWDDPTPMYTDNPYWSAYKNFQSDQRDRLFGNAGVNVVLLPWLKVTGRTGIDFYVLRMQERMAIGSQAQSEYFEDVRTVSERNMESFFTIAKRFADDHIGLNAILGANRMDRMTERSGGITNGGLVIPELFTLQNSLNAATAYDNTTKKRINSMYANASFDYNYMLYLDAAIRNDHSSTLAGDNRSYFYPSVSMSFILSEIEALRDNSFLSFAKLRAGYAEVGNDTDPYELLTYYTTGVPFGSNPMLNVPTSLPAGLDLMAERTKSWEVGTELKFLQNRFGVELSLYNKQTINQIVPIQVSGTTGVASFKINTGSMTNKGFEALITGTPVKMKNFRWDVIVNFATLNNTVDELSDDFDLKYLSLQNAPFRVQIGAFVGETYPIIYGTDFVYDNDGNKIIRTNGQYASTPIKPLGKVTPDFNGGITNTLTYKGFDFSFLIDMQRGGHMYYLSHVWGMYSGILEETAKLNDKGINIREAVADGGGIRLEGVIGNYDAANGYVYLDASGAVVETAVPNEKYVSGVSWAARHYNGPDAQNVFSTDYFKLREVRFGYTIPERYTGPIKSLRASVFGRNLLTWGQENQHFDPEYLQMAGSNAQGAEGGYLPSTRTWGFGLSFNF
ncbi:MAG: SusC/RagA family TonB-linked outer membrane protein [Lentimicrobium sp.]|nr:SusC/RagA family TonB-linked outer membrane protein [Lentimicrobium sp.]